MINIQHADVYQPRGGHVYPPHVYYYPRGPPPFPTLFRSEALDQMMMDYLGIFFYLMYYE